MRQKCACSGEDEVRVSRAALSSGCRSTPCPSCAARCGDSIGGENAALDSENGQPCSLVVRLLLLKYICGLWLWVCASAGSTIRIPVEFFRHVGRSKKLTH